MNNTLKYTGAEIRNSICDAINDSTEIALLAQINGFNIWPIVWRNVGLIKNNIQNNIQDNIETWLILEKK